MTTPKTADDWLVEAERHIHDAPPSYAEQRATWLAQQLAEATDRNAALQARLDRLMQKLLDWQDGAPAWYIMLMEVLPNARGPLIVDACLRMGYTAILIGTLGFLGVGLRPPDPDWGGMIRDTYSYMLGGEVHMALAPAFDSK